MRRLGSSPPPTCMCGHPLHLGRCQWRRHTHVGGRDWYGPYACDCPNGEPDTDQ
jgi:hypothetical protein